MWLIQVLFSAAFVAESLGAGAAGGQLYFTNGTCIWSLALGSGAAAAAAGTPVALTCAARRAVGLAVDADLIFWSDVDDGTAGVYRASVANPGDTRKIVSGVETVNALAVDRVGRLLYWTDEDAQLIEVAAYDGSMRAIVVSHDLGKPRGLLVDSLAGYVYWNDQEKGTLERCRLDGSERRVLLKRYALLWPNQMAFGDDRLSDSRLLFFADGFTGRVHSYDGRTGETARALPSRLSPENVTLFGLTVDYARRTLYASDWAGSIHELRAARLSGSSASDALSLDGATRRTLAAGYSTIFSLVLSTASSPTPSSSACRDNNGGCSHLCLLKGDPASGSRRCACPSYSGLALDADGRRCREPQHVLVYASAGNRFVAFRDLSGWNSTGGGGDDLYVVARSGRPVAVAYDPVTKVVFWSDVEERFIAAARLNGSERRYLLPAASVGIVDGMAYDYMMGNLYFTNIGEIGSGADNKSFSWHTVEMIGVRTMARRIVINSLQRPRALAINHETEHLYVSDWGSDPQVIQCRMDGSEPVAIKLARRWSNPNALVVHDNHLYVLDARVSGGVPTLTRILIHAKDPTHEEQSLPGGIPYGLAVSDSLIYVSDVNSSSVYAFALEAFGAANVDVTVREVAEPMAMAYVPLPEAAETPTSVEDQGCRGYDICIKDEQHRSIGYCSNVGTAAIHKWKGGCTVPDRFALVADLSCVRIVDLDTMENGILVSRDPFASNIVGLAYDRKSETVYYSDADESNIYAVNLRKPSEPRLVFNDNGTIDALAFDEATATLYWSVAVGSQPASYISAMDAASESSAKRRTVVQNLVEPRGLLVVDGTLYWTERGRSPRVQYKRSSGDGATGAAAAKVWNMRWPSGRMGLRSPNSIASSAQRTHIGDYDEIVTCSRQDTDKECSSHAVDHVFGLAAAPNGSILYYTDWTNSMVASIDEVGSVRRLLTGCVRPAMLVIVEGLAGNEWTDKRREDDVLPGWLFLVVTIGGVVVLAAVVALLVLWRRRRARPGLAYAGSLSAGGVGEDNNAYSMTEKPSTKSDKDHVYEDFKHV